MVRARRLVVAAAFALASTWVHAADKSIEVRECDAGTEFLDTTSFQCVQCQSPPNKPLEEGGLSARIPDFEELLRPYVDRPSYTVSAGCRCSPGYVKNSEDLFSSAPCNKPLALNNYWCDTFRCEACAEASALDNLSCLPCGDPGSAGPGPGPGPGEPPLGDGNSTAAPTAAPTATPTVFFDAASRQCQCVSDTDVLRERGAQGELLAFKVCEPCPTGSLLRTRYLAARAQDGIQGDAGVTEADAYVCQQCPHAAMQVHNDRCVCALPSDNSPLWTQVGVEGIGGGVTCILTVESLYVNKQRFAEIEYHHVSTTDVSGSGSGSGDRRSLRSRSLQSAAAASSGYTSYVVKNSIVFSHYFPIAGARCRYLRDAAGLAGCQTLANLCALQHYDESTPACELMSDIHDQRNSWSDVSWDWRQLTPWLRYEDLSQSVLSDIGIEMEFSFNMAEKEGTYDFMQLVLARYALDGRFIGWTNVTTEFEFCTPTRNQVPRWRSFGYGYERTYSCNLFNILSFFPEPEFYDMYVVDYAEGGRLYPVPVRNRNLRSRDRFPNENSRLEQQADDLLTRRFFLYDHVSSKVSVSDEPAVVRFAKTIRLTTTVQSLFPNKIHPPVLEILYEDRLVSDFFALGVDEQGNPADAATNEDVSFAVEYTEDYEDFWKSTSAFFAMAMTLMGLVSLLRLYNWSRRNSRLQGDAPVDFVFLARGVSYVLSTFAQVFFWFLFVYGAYFFVFFKMQDNVHLLLPVRREDYASDDDYYAFYVTLQVCFFGQLARMMEIVLVQSNVDIFFLDWEKPRGRVTSKRGDGTKTKFAPVSVWRTIFMANEWNELQRLRRYDVDLVMLLLATILVAADVQYVATPTPNFRDLTVGPLNIVLRFFNTSFWFLVIAYGQVLWRFLVQDRYITEPPTHSFVDLCTMAKVSVFVLDEEYHGYYLHCRSQHEFADCSMLEVSRQLRQEAEGLTTDRGLPGCPAKGLQTFEIYVTGEWKRQYNHIYRTMMSEELQAAHADTGSFLLRVLRKKGAKPAAEKLVRASKKLNAFLRGFVNQESSAFPIQHREQTFLHRFLHTPPEMVNSKANIFFPDTFYGYDKVLFYGETWNLVLFNILAVATFDYWWDNTMAAIFFAFLLDKLFVVLRVDLFGNANLSAKTLVDDRFLI